MDFPAASTITSRLDRKGLRSTDGPSMPNATPSLMLLDSVSPRKVAPVTLIGFHALNVLAELARPEYFDWPGWSRTEVTQNGATSSTLP